MCPNLYRAGVAQLVEQALRKRWVGSSSLSAGTNSGPQVPPSFALLDRVDRVGAYPVHPGESGPVKLALGDMQNVGFPEFRSTAVLAVSAAPPTNAIGYVVGMRPEP